MSVAAIPEVLPSSAKDERALLELPTLRVHPARNLIYFERELVDRTGPPHYHVCPERLVSLVREVSHVVQYEGDYQDNAVLQAWQALGIAGAFSAPFSHGERHLRAVLGSHLEHELLGQEIDLNRQPQYGLVVLDVLAQWYAINLDYGLLVR